MSLRKRTLFFMCGCHWRPRSGFKSPAAASSCNRSGVWGYFDLLLPLGLCCVAGVHLIKRLIYVHYEKAWISEHPRYPAEISRCCAYSARSGTGPGSELPALNPQSRVRSPGSSSLLLSPLRASPWCKMPIAAEINANNRGCPAPFRPFVGSAVTTLSCCGFLLLAMRAVSWAITSMLLVQKCWAHLASTFCNNQWKVNREWEGITNAGHVTTALPLLAVSLPPPSHLAFWHI